ncbi:MAG TPA: DUF4426 domain-containing protein [Pseudomonadales bacterium]|nr:DUF4426 domain-containing protein [Pseudomonadales bacterium]
MYRPAALLALICVAPLADADAVACDGDKVEYTTFLSSVIPPRVAEAHDIVRSDRRLMANITVLHQGKATTARVTGSATNLLNQVTVLDFREVTESDAIYYLASLVVAPRDTVRFDVTVLPAGSTQACKLQFARDYYREGPS